MDAIRPDIDPMALTGNENTLTASHNNNNPGVLRFSLGHNGSLTTKQDDSSSLNSSLSYVYIEPNKYPDQSAQDLEALEAQRQRFVETRRIFAYEPDEQSVYSESFLPPDFVRL